MICIIFVKSQKNVVFNVLFYPRRVSIAGSLIGGLPETQECMDFCAKHNIIPDTKVIKADELDSVYTALSQKNDSIIRYVLDVAGSA